MLIRDATPDDVVDVVRLLAQDQPGAGRDGIGEPLDDAYLTGWRAHVEAVRIVEDHRGTGVLTGSAVG